MQLLSFKNAKTSKGESQDYLTAILYLAPFTLSGTNLCPKASKGCAQACLFTAGRGVMRPVQEARMRRTEFYLKHRQAFIDQIKEEIRQAKRKAERKGMKLCVRLNGTSDIVWEKVSDIIQSFPDVQFYEYTKIFKRFNEILPANLDLTFSLSESNEREARQALARGERIAIVFKGEFPLSYWGYPVVSGDNTDLRFLDSKGVIVALKAKGKARYDKSGFVRDAKEKREELAA